MTSLPSRGAWIEMAKPARTISESQRSLPSRGAWIEIRRRARPRSPHAVAPLAGSVD